MRIVDTQNPISARERGSIGRRVFLDLLAIGTIAGVMPAPCIAAGRAEREDERKPRYRESPHVHAFYRVNRYP